MRAAQEDPISHNLHFIHPFMTFLLNPHYVLCSVWGDLRNRGPRFLWLLNVVLPEVAGPARAWTSVLSGVVQWMLPLSLSSPPCAAHSGAFRAISHLLQPDMQRPLSKALGWF